VPGAFAYHHTLLFYEDFMYQPLARKYRPQTFSELVGQETTTEILTRAIQLKREPHALILSGIRGVGKTTFARLYAKALNCENGPTPTPCSTCESCRLIARGSHEDVVEIDGASNNGVDEVRRLQETLHYVPQRSHFKIYILDEVHMLSVSAFNALLKSLEEPPPHVVFIFATTELSKIPDTVLGRCQIFHLKKIDTATMSQRLQSILQQEKISYDIDSVFDIARGGRGSLRDALTLLDQTIALGDGTITRAAVSELLPHVSLKFYFSLLQALQEKSGKACIEILQKLDANTDEYTDVIEELLRQIRNASLLQHLSGVSTTELLRQLMCNEQELEYLQTWGSKAAVFEVNRLFRTFMKCREELDGSEMDRYVVENYCLEWCLDPGFPSIESLLESAAGTETIEAVSHVLRAVPSSTPVPTATTTPVILAAQKPVADTPAVDNTLNTAGIFPPTWQALIDAWKKHQPLQARKLEEVYLLEYTPTRISVAVDPTSMLASSLLQKEIQKKIEDQFRVLFQFTGTFIASLHTDPHPPSESLLDKKEKEQAQFRIDIEQQARTHPFTREIETQLGGKILRVELQETKKP
jgi:DNA polymerase III subunit gamma/tau